MDIALQNVVFQLILAVVLLKVSGEIGKLSLHQGYASMMTAYSSGNLSFNLFFRVLYAPIAICLVSIALLYFDKSFLTKDIWLTAVWYFLIQTVLSFGRLAYTKPTLFFGSALVSVWFSYIFYIQGIQKGLTALMPATGDMTTELWLIIIFFFYEVLRNKDISPSHTEQDKRFEDKYLKLKTKYKPILNDDFRDNKILNDVLFSIMIFEDFNRPKLFRTLERILFGFGFVQSTGIMQVKSSRPLDDFESVLQAQDIILGIYEVSHTRREHDLVGAIFVAYNPDAYYRQEVRSIYYRVAQTSVKLEEGQYNNSQVDIVQNNVEDSSIDEILGQLNILTKQLGNAGNDMPEVLSLSSAEIKKLSPEDLEEQVNKLQNVINRMERDLVDTPQYDHVGKSIVFPEDEALVYEIKPSIKIQGGYELPNKFLLRELANDLESAGYSTLIKERDMKVEDDFSSLDEEYDMDLNITVQVGNVGFSAAILIGVAFHGLLKGAFTEAGKDLYKIIKDKYFKKKTKEMEGCFVELFVKTKERTNTKNVRIYIYLSNEEDCEKLPEAMKFAEENIKGFEESDVREVMLILKGDEWIAIEGEKHSD